MLLALLAATQFNFTPDYSKALRDYMKHKGNLNQLVEIRADSSTCAIPLKEIHVQAGTNMDPISRPTGRPNFGRMKFDKIAHPVPVPACPSHSALTPLTGSLFDR
jgi:hypothetical protein